MDKLNRSGAILNLKNEDLGFLQNAFRDGFLAICSAYGIGQVDSFILSGCEQVINGTNIDVSAGYIALAGEICKVDVHTVHQHDPGSDPAGFDNFWVIAPVNDPAGSRAVQAGGSENTWQIRKAKLIHEETGLNPVRFDIDIPTIHVLGASKMKTEMVAQINQDFVFNAIAPLNGWVNVGATSHKDAFGRVYVQGIMDGTNATNTKMFDFPSGWHGTVYAPTDNNGVHVSVNGSAFSASATGSVIRFNFSYKVI